MRLLSVLIAWTAAPHALVACDHPPSATRAAPATASHPAEVSQETDTPDPLNDTAVVGSRDRALPPLCVEDALAAVPVIPPDVADWADALEASDNFLHGKQRLVALEALGEDLPAEDEVVLRLERGWHRLAFGHVVEAIDDLSQAEALASTDRWRPRIRALLSAAWLRRAELENCTANANRQSCLLPLSGGGIHAVSGSAEQARDTLLRYLEGDEPEGEGAPWLLNVAHMALGTWPHDVPEPWRLAPPLFESEAASPGWVNAGTSLLSNARDYQTLAGGAALEDIDGDGLLDIVTSSAHPEQGMRLLLNVGDGTFCDASYASGLQAAVGVLSFTTGDLDNDGSIDIIAPRGGWLGTEGEVRPSLLMNDGSGRFVDTAPQAGLAAAVGASQVAAVADIDGDGALDLFIGRERAWSGGDHPSSLYRNLGDGTFEEVTEAWGVDAPGIVKGAAFGDFDDDGRIDLYITRLGEPNLLLRNTGSRFEPVDQPAIQEPLWGFTPWFFDYDQDGDLDLFVAAYPQRAIPGDVFSPRYGQGADAWLASLHGTVSEQDTPRLFRNDGGVFVDVTAQAGLDRPHATMGGNYGDLDGDGYPDIYLGNGAPGFDALEPNTALRNERGVFRDVTTDAGLGHLQKGHGVAFGDLNESGAQDLLAQLGGIFQGDASPDALFLNPTLTPALTLRLEGVQSPRDATGARIQVVTPQRTIHDHVSPGGSFGNNSRQRTIGLGDVSQIDRIEILWPSGLTEILPGTHPGQMLTIREGHGVVHARPLRRFAFAVP